MNVFHCDHCDHLLFFENVQCIRCKHVLAYLPDRRDVSALEPVGPDCWRPLSPGPGAETYRLCRNYVQENVCNWAVPADETNGYCLSCRLTRIIPNLSQPGNREAWYRLEVAKRRLVYSLLGLDLPLQGKAGAGLVFEFLADMPGAPPILTGHDRGRITVNVAEADDSEREKRRTAMHEGYRTLLGHFRHEVGHYYWGQLVDGGQPLGDFRERFGDERQDYGEALQRHYKEGPPLDWQERFISAYASAHPWEDWAETWAHYLHITDTLETAASCGLRLRPQRPDEPALKAEAPTTRGCRPASFERMIDQWFPLTYVLNNLNRGMGLPDGYPFVLSPAVIQKLRLVHEVVTSAAQPDPWSKDSAPLV